MPTKEEIIQFVSEKLDKTHYQDYLLYYKESKKGFVVKGKRIEPTAEELVDDL